MVKNIINIFKIGLIPVDKDNWYLPVYIIETKQR